jgi:DNA-binding response OmpR family regulator
MRKNMAKRQTARKHILIIHNDPDMATALRLPLESAGYVVSESDTNQEGLRRIAQAAPDLVILDIALETAASLQVSLELRNPSPDSQYAAYRRLPILMLTTAHTAASLLSEPEACLPMDDFVEKPLDPDALLDKVRALIP